MIRFENVTKRYRGTKTPALDELNFEIPAGEFVFLVGASGSGKSTCLRLILREDTPSKGRVLVLGSDLRRMSNRKVPYFRRNIGSVFQDFRLLPTKTVFQNVAFTMQVTGASRAYTHAAVPEALELVGLADKAKRMPHELSGGEQQRVAIARAIVNRPQILLADEPTGNLDPATSTDIMRLLARINANGTTVVMATHEAGFVDQMQRRVIELKNGVMVRDEMQGGYGDTSSIERLTPATERGAASTAALSAVREVQRELAADAEDQAPAETAEETPAAVIAEAVVTETIVSEDGSRETHVVEAVVVDEHVATDAAEPVAEPAVQSEDSQPEQSSPVTQAAAPVRSAAPVAEPTAAQSNDAEEASEPAAPTPPITKPAAPPKRPQPSAEAAAAAHTGPIRPIDAPAINVSEAGVADRLGLADYDDEDEVGPTS